MGPGILLLGLAVRDLCDQLIVTDLEVASAEYLRDDQGPCGLDLAGCPPCRAPCLACGQGEAV